MRVEVPPRIHEVLSAVSLVMVWPYLIATYDLHISNYDFHIR